MALKEQTTLWHPLTYFLLFPSTWKLDFVQGLHASLSSQLIYPQTTRSPLPRCTGEWAGMSQLLPILLSLSVAQQQPPN